MRPSRCLPAFVAASALAVAPHLAAAQSAAPPPAAPPPAASTPAVVTTLAPYEITATPPPPSGDLLGRARAALRRGNARAALRVLRHHAQTEPEIALLVTLEREASHPHAVEREMLRYLARYPDGPRAESYRDYLGPLPPEALPHETTRRDDDDEDDDEDGETADERLAAAALRAVRAAPASLRAARRCLQRGDWQCALAAVRDSRAPTEPELALRAVLARDAGAHDEAVTAMRSYLLRHPDGPRAPAFREYLGPEYDVGARAMLLDQARVCARVMDLACVVRLLDGRARTAPEVRLLTNARRVLVQRAVLRER